MLALGRLTSFNFFNKSNSYINKSCTVFSSGVLSHVPMLTIPILMPI